ncbi:MAG: cytochrome c biogenesis protein [Candidatus Accumulibacter sp.]|nr:cytochrome c biogenesis protein [Accumulibacter sp.]
METSRLVLAIEALLLLFALIAASLPGRANRAAAAPWLLAAAAGVVYAGMRYRASWPMTPMFAGSVLHPPLLAVLGALSLRGSDPQNDPGGAPVARRWLIAFGLAATLAGVFFPKDFYLPMIKTTSPYAHGALLFGSLARACLFVAGAWGCAALRGHDAMPRVFRWMVWGFGFWTLSLFSGEMWSYTGWGVPMVWEDASTLTAIGTWLFYVGVIHLYLGGLSSRRTRAAMSVLGAVLILALNGGPDMGPFVDPLAVAGGAR